MLILKVSKSSFTFCQFSIKVALTSSVKPKLKHKSKDKNISNENEIDLIIEENGILYPVEIKMSGNPKANMGATNQVLDKIPDKQRGMGIIVCLIDKKTYLKEN